MNTTDKDVDPIISYSLVNHQDKFEINPLSGTYIAYKCVYRSQKKNYNIKSSWQITQNIMQSINHPTTIFTSACLVTTTHILVLL